MLSLLEIKLSSLRSVVKGVLSLMTTDKIAVILHKGYSAICMDDTFLL